MSTIQIEVGDKILEFASYSQWVSKAQSWFAQHRIASSNSICIDAKGRICRIGADFKRAMDDDAYPVSVYRIG